MRHLLFFRYFLIVTFVFLSGCSTIVSYQTAKFSEHLAATIKESNDIETIGLALPPFLLMMDTLIMSAPEDETMLIKAAQANSIYAGVFSKGPNHKKNLFDKAMSYAQRSICLINTNLCLPKTMNFKDFQTEISQNLPDDISFYYTFAATWLGWIEAHKDDWSAIAGIARVKYILKMVAQTDGGYDNGSTYMYLGALETIIPPALGGNPELGKAHFEKALAFSGGRNQMVNVIYAKNYARMLFDQVLHHDLLVSVLNYDGENGEFNLMNAYARQEAQKLLDSEQEYFE